MPLNAPLSVAATKTAALVVDTDGDGKADPGDTLGYTVVISASGGDATGVSFNDTPDANTTLVPGSIAASPVAVNDTYPQTVIGNVSINSANIPYSVVTNDFLGLNPAATISAFDATSVQGGQVVMTTSGVDMGKFTYNPPPGFEGTDTFTYTLTDNANASSSPANRTATVSITVSGMVWFINNAAAPCTTLLAGCGRLSNPFSTLAAFNALNNGTGNNPAANDNIFIYESGTQYTGAVTLQSGQKLIGQDATASLSTITGLTPPTGSASLPAMNSGNGTITNIGSTVTLNTNTTVRGLQINSTTSIGMNDPGSAITGVSVSEVSVTTTTASAVSLSDLGGTLSFIRISSNGGTSSGIILSNTTGSFTVNGDGVNTTKGGNASGGTLATKDDGGVDNDGTIGTGVYLNNAQNVTLRRMQLNDLRNYGIRGLNVTGFTLQYSTINGTNGDTTLGEEGNIAFGKSNPSGTNGLLGSGLIDNCKISGGVENNLEFYNQSGTLNTLTISNSDIKSNSAATGNDGILIEAQSTAVMTVSVQSSIFDDNKSQAVQLNVLDTSAADIAMNNNTLQRTTQGNEGFVLQNAASGKLTAHVTNNTSTGIGGVVIFVGNVAGNATTSSSLTAYIAGNNITHPTSAANSAIIAFLSSCNGVNCTAQSAPSNILINSNTVTENSTQGVARGIFVDTPDSSTTPSFTVSATNNHVSVGDNVAGLQGIGLQARRGTGCFDVRLNTVTFPNGTPAGVNGIRVRQASPGTANLEQGVSASSTAATVLTDNNTATADTVGTVTVVSNSTCQNPPTSMLQTPNNNQTVAQNQVEPNHTGDARTSRTNLNSANLFKQTATATPDETANTVAKTSVTGDSHGSLPWLFAPTAAPVSVSIGTLPAGKSVTIKFRVTVNSPVPGGTTQVSNQGTVSGSNFSDSLTDDPSVGGASDPTVTPLDVKWVFLPLIVR